VGDRVGEAALPAAAAVEADHPVVVVQQARLLATPGAWPAGTLGPPVPGGYLARADGLDLTVITRL
ncbi:hypothetical protein AB0A74_36665, partial [Saccharothrix sp. NPDC042600]